MITDLNELATRLQLHFELLVHETESFDKDDNAPLHPLGNALLSAIDLVEEIQRTLKRNDQTGVDSVVRAWASRRFDGRAAPKAVE